jgi:hypothetical protein
MKGFLQSIGVLEADPIPTPAAAMPVTTEPAPVTFAIPEPESSSQPEPVGIESRVPSNMLQNVVNGLRGDLMGNAGLIPLFEFTAAVNKLKRVPEMKDRILTAIDLVGQDGATILGFANRYNSEVKRVAEAFFMRCKAEVGTSMPKMLKDAEDAEVRMQGLKLQYEAAQREYEEKNQLVVDADTELALAEEAAHLAAEMLMQEFDETSKALKEALQ